MNSAGDSETLICLLAGIFIGVGSVKLWPPTMPVLWVLLTLLYMSSSLSVHAEQENRCFWGMLTMISFVRLWWQEDETLRSGDST
jgi:hypothetical protein